jgi:hypothetical protein
MYIYVGHVQIFWASLYMYKSSVILAVHTIRTYKAAQSGIQLKHRCSYKEGVPTTNGSPGGDEGSLIRLIPMAFVRSSQEDTRWQDQ